jgi:hypothetical protein
MDNLNISDRKLQKYIDIRGYKELATMPRLMVSTQAHQMYHMYIVLMYQGDQPGEQFHDKLDQKVCL